MRYLQSPLDESTVRSLKAGDIVYVSGQVITARDEAHIRALEYLDDGKDVPECLYGCTLYHCGPIILERDDGYELIAAGPTTSARMNSLEPRFIKEFGVRVIIGKGGMSSEVVETMKECGCVYLAATGGAAVTLAEGLSKVDGVEWKDLGMAESIWRFDSNRLGPLVVAMDSNGDSLYENVRSSMKR